VDNFVIFHKRYIHWGSY